MMRVIVTGGAGFIGSALVRHLVLEKGYEVLNVDALTYAGNLASLRAVEGKPNYRFLKANICDRGAMERGDRDFAPDRIMHLAAESHVDRSITGAADFIQTNVVGTFTLLEAARGYWSKLEPDRKADFRFLHVSTDEVYGSLGDEGLFTEDTPYDPSSPYSASKAVLGSSRQGLAADLRPAGRRLQLLEQLRALSLPRKADPADDPERARGRAAAGLRQGRERPRLALCRGPRPRARPDRRARQGWVRPTMSAAATSAATSMSSRASARCSTTRAGRTGPGEELIEFVTDRPGHDARYAIDATKLEDELGWRARENFDSGIEKTVRWYLDNEWWWQPLRERYAGERLGLLDKRQGLRPIDAYRRHRSRRASRPIAHRTRSGASVTRSSRLAVPSSIWPVAAERDRAAP